MSATTIALTLGEAKTIAVLIVIVFLVGAVGAMWLLQTIAQKAAIAVILGLLALLVWSQRSSLDTCADKVRAEVRAAGTLRVETTCSFLGRDVQISTTRDDVDQEA